jgi:uncharacterized protein
MKKIFINLPVEDLEKSMHFYAQMGFTAYPLFTGENQKCMVWSKHIYVMLQSKTFFGAYNKKTLVDARKHIASTFTLPIESLDSLNEIVENVLSAGGTEPIPALDEGYMQLRTIDDLDGHIWGLICLDERKFKKAKANNATQNKQSK